MKGEKLGRNLSVPLKLWGLGVSPVGVPPSLPSTSTHCHPPPATGPPRVPVPTPMGFGVCHFLRLRCPPPTLSAPAGQFLKAQCNHLFLSEFLTDLPQIKVNTFVHHSSVLKLHLLHTIICLNVYPILKGRDYIFRLYFPRPWERVTPSK